MAAWQTCSRKLYANLASVRSIVSIFTGVSAGLLFTSSTNATWPSSSGNSVKRISGSSKSSLLWARSLRRRSILSSLFWILWPINWRTPCVQLSNRKCTRPFVTRTLWKPTTKPCTSENEQCSIPIQRKHMKWKTNQKRREPITSTFNQQMFEYSLTSTSSSDRNIEML